MALKINNKYPAHALALTVIIGLVVAFLLTAILLLASYNRSAYAIFSCDNQVHANLSSAENFSLSDSGLFIQKDQRFLSLTNKTISKTGVERYLWGILDLAHITVEGESVKKGEAFFYGSSFPTSPAGCLYIADHKIPILLRSSSRLEGDIYVPEAGIKEETVGDRLNSKAAPVNGRVFFSSSDLPFFSSSIKKYIANLQQEGIDGNTARGIEKDTLVQSFKDSAICVRKKETIYLKDIFIKGHVAIQSNKRIEVDSSAHLENVLLIAPTIHFHKNFHGVVQAIASDSLLADNDCSFGYPSAFVLSKLSKNGKRAMVKIGMSSKLIGYIITLCPDDDPIKTLIEAGPNSFLEGLFLVHGYAAVRGKIYGAIATDYFIYKDYSGEYINHVVDIEINRKVLPDYFLFPSAFGGKGVRSIMEWVE